MLASGRVCGETRVNPIPSRGIGGVGGVGGLGLRLQRCPLGQAQNEGAPASGRSAGSPCGITPLELHARSAALPVARARTSGLPICPADPERLNRAAPVARAELNTSPRR